jgi:hypothetical protein
MHVLGNWLLAPGAKLADGCRLGVRFGEGWFRMVESHETSDDSPRRLTV